MAYPPLSVKSLDRFLGWTGFSLLAVPILIGPWLFGAWEMWWFWPFACFIFAAALVFGVRLLLPGANREPGGVARRAGRTSALSASDSPEKTFRNGRSRHLLVLSFLPFFAYALVCVFRAEVFMDAERSFLLFLTPILASVLVVFGFTRRQAHLLYALVFADLTLLGLYGLINHGVTGSTLVLWEQGYPAYVSEHRATGSYFCPDHFSGIMELGLCLALGRFLDRETRWPWRLWAVALAGIAFTGIILSKSRGGGLTVLVIGAAVLVWGYSQWPPVARWCYRVSAVSVAGIGLIVFSHFAGSYTERFSHYFGWQRAQSKTWQEKREIVVRSVTNTARGQMIAAALRAWREHPIMGIGPGQHQNIWPHVAASPDGDRETGRWPSRLNTTFVSYEVHSDWVQLLEEYGLIGLGLFLVPFWTVLCVIFGGLRREMCDRERNHWRQTGRRQHALVLGAWLAFGALAFHSFGDFNLQMPATTWLLAAILAVPINLVTASSCYVASHQ